METQLKIIGALFILLAAVHVVFPKYFKWRQELASLSLVNKQMMQVHTFFIALTVFLMGLLCLFCAHDLITTPLGNKISASLAFFWFCRLLAQFFVYSKQLWQGKILETIIHIIFSIAWLWFTIVFFLVYKQAA